MPYLHTWILSFGLDPTWLRVLAVSFSPIEMPEPIRPIHTLGSTLGTLVLQGSAAAAAFGNAVQIGGVGGAAAGGGPAEGEQKVVVLRPETEMDVCARRMGEWPMERVSKREAQRWVCLKNTDLRAGDEWLVYVSPTTKAQMGLDMRDR